MSNKANNDMGTVLKAVNNATQLKDIEKQKENIEGRRLGKPMHLQPVFADAPYYGGNVAENLFNNGLCLPSGSNLTTEDLERIKNVIENML